MKKHFTKITLAILMGISLKLPAQTLTGHLDNLSAFFPVTIYAYGIPDSTNFLSAQTDASGNFFFDFSSFNSGAAYAYCYFIDCSGNVVDSTFSLNTFSNIWNADYCANSGGGGGGGNCNVSFTTSYDSVSNTFSLYLDTAGFSSGFYPLWNFGDGTYSTDWFPSHEFTSNSLFDVCVYMTEWLTGDSCWYCHVIGFDSSGNVVLKPSDVGFHMQVLPAEASGIAQTDNIKPAGLYPNPASHTAMLQFVSAKSESVEISIGNSIAQQIKIEQWVTVSGLNQIPLDVSDLPAGMYIVTVKSASQQWSEKLMK